MLCECYLVRLRLGGCEGRLTVWIYDYGETCVLYSTPASQTPEPHLRTTTNPSLNSAPQPKESISPPSPSPLTLNPPNHHPHPSAATTQNTRSTSPTVVFPWLSLPNSSRNRSSTTPPRSYSARSYSHAAPSKARWASARRVRRKASARRTSSRRSRDTRPMWGVWALKGMRRRVLGVC